MITLTEVVSFSLLSNSFITCWRIFIAVSLAAGGDFHWVFITYTRIFIALSLVAGMIFIGVSLAAGGFSLEFH